MQIDKFNWKLFNIDYTNVKLSELWVEARLDSEFYSFDFIRTEKFLLEWDRLWDISTTTDLQSNWAFAYLNKTLNDNNKKIIPYIRSWNVWDFFISKEDLIFISEEAHLKLTKTHTYNNDILMARKWKIGGATIVTNDCIWFNSNDNVVNIKINNDDILPEYFVTFFNSKFWFNQIERMSTWNVQPWMSMYQLRNLKIKYPSEKLQKKIKELVIESYNQKELSEKLYRESETLLLTEFDLFNYQTKTKHIELDWSYEMEVKENHSIINYNILTELDRFDAEYWDYDFVETKNRVINIKSEKLWKLVDYKKWIEVWSWAYIEESEIENNLDKKYFLRISNFSTNGMTFNNAKFIKNNNFKILQDYQPKKWEILFSKDWTAWITYLLREDIDWIISWWILRFQNISNIPSEYLELVLNSILIQKEIERQTNGALIQHLKITDALNFDIPLIWDDKIKIITEKIQQSFEAKTKSKNLLKVAKKWVEIYIENEEKDWIEYIKSNI